jgi:hypothetical protein
VRGVSSDDQDSTRTRDSSWSTLVRFTRSGCGSPSTPCSWPAMTASSTSFASRPTVCSSRDHTSAPCSRSPRDRAGSSPLELASEVPLAMLRTTPIRREANHEDAVVLDPDGIAHVPGEDGPGRRTRVPRSRAGRRSHTKHQRSRRGHNQRAAHRSSRPRATLIVTSHEGPGYPSRAPTEPWSPSSRGLGRRPFKAEARVRIPLGARGRHFGADAQPHICACGGVRSSSSPCQGEDRGIEARQARDLSSGFWLMPSLGSALAASLAASRAFQVSASTSPSSRATPRRVSGCIVSMSMMSAQSSPCPSR